MTDNESADDKMPLIAATLAAAIIAKTPLDTGGKPGAEVANAVQKYRQLLRMLSRDVKPSDADE